MRGPAAIFHELSQHYFPRDAPPEDDAAFARHAHAQLQPQANLMMFAVLAFCVLWWPTDLLVARHFPGAARAFVGWRLGVPLVVLAHLATSRLPRPELRLALTYVACGAILGWATSRAGGLERPWAHVLCIVNFATLTMPLAPRSRAAITPLIGASVLAGLTLSAPANLRSPYLAFLVVMSVAMTVLSVALGHSQYLLVRKNFLQELTLARYSQRLEGQVAERTAELRLLLAGIESAREEERARISRDLHDSLGQELAALRYALTYARQRYESDRDGARANLAELDALLGQVTTTTRAILHDLRPRLLDDLGLAEVARWLAGNVARRAGLRCEVEVEGAEHAGAVPAARSASLFRIMQESLSNVTRHARATAAVVSLAIGPDGAVTLEVRDDGVGCEGPPGGGALGLLNMRERAESMGGRFELTTRPHFEGTRVRVVVPA